MLQTQETCKISTKKILNEENKTVKIKTKQRCDCPYFTASTGGSLITSNNLHSETVKLNQMFLFVTHPDDDPPRWVLILKHVMWILVFVGWLLIIGDWLIDWWQTDRLTCLERLHLFCWPQTCWHTNIWFYYFISEFTASALCVTSVTFDLWPCVFDVPHQTEQISVLIFQYSFFYSYDSFQPESGS